ncbi:LacI family DNA-binding transcriptional regulator [Pseudovibrio sp. Tun.PSC04-5.I4]|uniref:LacI family DNA-binding transcriptional regulator n=1 Tax=Pseudovibrio sp. Tun.PSC04-5.I4 TaxID=1798213 RepID=UPI00088DC46C|nr:LacI family DNA-binding transcriptional regulator [Pseudovibrio sp. Tun.PSC04-5.I4]SDR47743.1 transcriptional regulator, LacI family [Pseudovibrio sp. Tun.PSC04-5.I4]
MPKPTLVDVGQEAGVSAITVSRALRSPEKVSDALRIKVETAVKKLGYVPNQSASTLASSKTSSIVVMVPSISNNVFTDVLGGISESLQGSRFNMQIGHTNYDPLEEERILRSFLNPTPSGVILSGIEQTAETKKMLADVGVPIVQIMDINSDPIDRIVGFSHDQAGEEATQHLIDAGYQNIGFMGAQMDPRSQKRLVGFKKAIKAHGELRVESIAVTNKPSSVQLGALLFGKLTSTFPECDAVFCNNDDLAIGVLFECQRRGIRVPEDLGICGFNDLGITSETVPSITSISTPLREIGRIAGAMVQNEESMPTDRIIDLKYSVSARESTKRG